MSREDPHFRLRFPDPLRKLVSEAAHANHRSMTAEIIARLEGTFSNAQPTSSTPFRQAMEEFTRAMDKLCEIKPEMKITLDFHPTPDDEEEDE